ncbi:MAG: stage V sporulation protein AD [Clostridia bacterium]|nr:stage V sporulation protein AD [Clostridia bacterium]
MANKKIGTQTIRFDNPPSIISGASIVGKKEGEGPLGDFFDKVLEDDTYGEESWEKAERKMFIETTQMSIAKSGVGDNNIDFLLGGDLLNQIISASFAARELRIPFLGLYGACSTMSESLLLSSIIIDGGFADYIVCGASSHFSTAERQYRFPLEFGNQRKLTAQWTVTGCGMVTLSSSGVGPFITHATPGKVIDLGIKDADNMGAAMAPAAVDTIITHFNDTGWDETSYDLVVTGDLGTIGKNITNEMLKNQGYDISNIYIDCGDEIFDHQNQDTHAGGSGCGCAAVVLSSYLIRGFVQGLYRKILFISTGALLSPTSSLQGESIPSIAHAITIESGD